MTTLGPQHKSFPSRTWGLELDDLASLGLRVSDLSTPLVTLSADALRHNTDRMARWAQESGVQLAPHGKTTMAPALWQMLLDAGAWGITVATGWQAQVALTHHVPRVMIANEVLDPHLLGWLASAAHAGRVVLWCDSLAGVEAAERAAAAAGGSLEVIVDLGGTEGRTGVRSVPEALTVAEAVLAAGHLRLVGSGGYEGALAHDRGAASLAEVRTWCARLAGLHEQLLERFETDNPILTASGSLYFDVVGAALAGASGTSGTASTVVLRPGAAQIHDHGHYGHLSPLAADTDPLRPAALGWARVVSAAEPGLVVLDGGKRDFAYDLVLPDLRGRDGAPLPDLEVSALNDQHTLVRTPPGAGPAIGEVVRLGMSHPCTILDKWRLLPLIEEAGSEDPLVVGAVETWF
ncbi:alanine racemase [Ruania suaedae]|uniref:alanine racemase n=1 Tax=Ruania suaedae TaxID=2897774 RepID=UPI001E2C559F|nr:alanine racemase [Ruania suaedae]UFU03585.1 alanine racemase [Ruania suaedae]